MRGLRWATTVALLAGPSGAAGKDGGHGSRDSVPLSASKQALEEISPTAALVRLRGGILGVDLVHEIAKAYLMPGAGNGKGAGSDGGGNVGAPGETDGDKGGRAGGVARVDEGKAVGGESTSTPNTATSNRSNKDGVPASPPAKQKSRAGRRWEGFKFDRLAFPLKKKDDHNNKSNRDQPQNPRGSGQTHATPSAINSNDNGAGHYPGSRGTDLSGMDRNEADRSADRTETRIDSGVGGGGGRVGVGGRDDEDPVSIHEQIERLRAALKAAAAETEAGGVGVMDKMDLPRVGAGFQPKRQHQQQQQPVAGGGGGGDSVSLSSSAASPGTVTGLPELHRDGHGGWEWNEGPNESGNGSPKGNGRSGDGQVEDDVDISAYADGMGGGSCGGGGWEEDGDEEDEFDAEGAIAAARAAAAAARAREEIAFLREVEALSEQAAQNAGMPPPLGEHVKAVVTKDVPFRFADELGAQVATALAMAVFKGVTHTVMAHRGEKKPEKVSFSDVVGCDEAKDEIKQIVDFLVDPSAYDKLGAKRPKGILLVGPPGTGKTLIAKACAGEAGVPFLYACGSDFNGIYVGMGVAAVKRLFAKARRHKKSIIYIDEIDYLGRSRNSGARDASGATQDREATLNQLLSEMDGFEGKDGIVVMASTNRKDILDDALLRSGRFDMQVDVERPNRNGREQLFSKYIAPLKLSEGCANAMSDSSSDRPPSRPRVNRSRPGRSAFGGGAAAIAAAEAERQAEIEAQGVRDDLAKELADLTPYMTGADVANVCATAGRIAARAGSSVVTLEHFSAAVDRVCHGLEKPGKMVSKDEQRRTAVHEAGHAVVGWMLPWCDPVVKVSIIWRGNALGFSQSAMTERLSDMQETILDNVCMTLAGRAAEEVVFGTISGGASSDLRKASRALYTAITEIGFGSATGLLSPGDRRMSERVLAEIDQEVQNLLADQYQRALSLIRQYRAKIDLLAEALVDKGVIHKGELEAMLGEKVTLESAAAMAPVLVGSADGSADGAGVPVSGGGEIPSVGEQGNAGGSAPLGVARVVDNDICRRVIDAPKSELEDELAEHADGRYDERELEVATRMLKRPRFSFLRSHLWKQPAVWFAARSVTGLALSRMKSARAAAAQNRNDYEKPFDCRRRQ